MQTTHGQHGTWTRPAAPPRLALALALLLALVAAAASGQPASAQQPAAGGQDVCMIPEGCDADGDGVAETPAGEPAPGPSAGQYGDAEDPTAPADQYEPQASPAAPDAGSASPAAPATASPSASSAASSSTTASTTASPAALPEGRLPETGGPALAPAATAAALLLVGLALVASRRVSLAGRRARATFAGSRGGSRTDT